MQVVMCVLSKQIICHGRDVSENYTSNCTPFPSLYLFLTPKTSHHLVPPSQSASHSTRPFKPPS